MIQILQGISIKPQGSNNRFVSQNWPPNFGFNSWIFNVSADLSYSEKPSEVKISFVLETSTFSQSASTFDISEADLNCSAGNGGLSNESSFTLELDGITLYNMLLYSYQTRIEAGQKVLDVVFKDYSMILDKIYVGLFKKQGYLYPHLLNCTLELPIRCQDCTYTGESITGTGFANRDIGFGCYFGTNGNTYDLFENVYYTQESVFQAWYDNIITDTTQVSQVDLNGGYLILGTETATEERCNSAPNITYSFTELICALRKNGLNFSGSFPYGTGDSDYVYRNNHNGSLREVLQNWCSDLAYTFYCSGRTFIGINLQNPIDISAITQIGDPNSSVGQYFEINASSGNSAILNLNLSASLENTFMQSVVVDNSYPITQKDISKSVKKYVGITPLHPISLNQISSGSINDYNLYGTSFFRRQFETPVFDYGQFNQSYFATFGRLDGRSYSDVDAAIALSNYNDALRDIFVAQRALNNIASFGGVLSNTVQNNAVTGSGCLTNPYCAANFAALGMFPLMEVTDNVTKAGIIRDNFTNADKNNISNINIDQQFFRVFIGYYYSDLKDSIVAWEKAAANSMYKYGIVTKGILTDEPFVPPNLLTDISPTAGFFGLDGLIYTRVTNTFTPNTERYAAVQYTPFADALLYSGYVSSNSQGSYYNNNNQYNPFIPPGYSDYPGRLPTGLWVSTLDNSWGTLQTDFARSLSFNLDDPCADQYSISEGVQNILSNSEQTLQDWKIEYFKPIVNSDLATISDYIQGSSGMFSGYIDEVISTYTNLNYIQKKDCKKLSIFVIPDTTGHPNVQINFTPMPVNKINKVVLGSFKQKLYEADLRKNTTETPSICSISLLDEMCRNILSGANGFNAQFNPPLNNQQIGCVIMEDKNNYMLEGFESGILFAPNARSLDISITKNPNNAPYPTLDNNGDYYYSDLGIGSLILNTSQVNTSIVYPIQSFPNSYSNYSGILQSDITTEYRLPAFAQVFGTPVNITNNNTSSFKLVMNTVDSTLDPQLDPLTTEVKSYITVLDGSGNSIIKTPQEYYNYVQNLNNYNLTTPTKEVSLTLAGPPSQFGGFTQYLTPGSGLQQFKLSITDNGVKTDLVFADRPKVLPKQESLLNKIGPRIKGVYN